MNDARAVPRPSEKDLRDAHQVVEEHLPPTPTLPMPELGDSVWLKVESMQPTGSFKVRGALASLNRVPEGHRVVTASAGNHGLAMAWAGDQLGRDVTVVVPETASPAKIDGLRARGVNLELVGEGFDEAEAYAMSLPADEWTYISSYNDTQVIAGQSTIGVELDALPRPLTVVCPVGGGGLLAGIGCWASGQSDVRLIGVEPANSCAMAAALGAGHAVAIEESPTIADGLAGGIEPGAVTVDLVAEQINSIVTVTEAEIRGAIRHLLFRHGLMAEGAGAVATAACLSGSAPLDGNVLVLLTGRNIAQSKLGEVIAESTPEPLGEAGDLAPPAGAYVPARRSGQTLYVSGQAPIDERSGEVVGSGITEQTTKVMSNLEAVLRANGLGLADLVKVNVHIADFDLFEQFDRAYAEYLGAVRPARTTVASGLGDILVEIDAVASFGS